MTTLAEIESAAEALSPDEKRELFLFLADRLRGENAPLPAPRVFTSEEVATWIAEGGADIRHLECPNDALSNL